MVYAYAYAGKNSRTIQRTQETRVTNLESTTNTLLPLLQPTIIQDVTFQFQGTQFVAIPDNGDARVYPNSAPSTIDEETNAAVTAYATFNDLGGSGATVSNSVYEGDYIRVPLEDNEGRTAYYHGHWKHLQWSPYLHPTVAHTKQFMAVHSAELNVPGTDSLDQKGFIYYDSHANFNMATSSSMSLWFYPTNISQLGGGFFRWLLQRYVNATTWFVIAIASGGADAGKVLGEVNDAGVLRKIMTSTTVNLNAWNLIIMTYDVSTDVLTLYLNGSGPITSAYAGGTVNPWPGDSNMFVGGIPFSPNERFTGYLDNFVFWTGKILTGTEADNMWTRGTIV